MADENKENEEVEVEIKKKGEGKTIVILLLLVVAVIIITPMATIYILKSVGGGSKEEVDKPDDQATDGYFEYTTPEMIVNISGTKGTRLLVFQITVHCTKKEMLDLFQEKPAEGAPIKSLWMIFKSEIETIASSKNLDELTAVNARKRLSKDFHIALNKIKNQYHPKMKAQVSQVFISKFQMQ